MKIRYFVDTDTLFMEFSDAPSVETRELDENTIIDMDASGQVCTLTLEHASARAGAPSFTYEQVSA